MNNKRVLILLIDNQSISENIIIKSLPKIKKFKSKFLILGDKLNFSKLAKKIDLINKNNKKIIFLDVPKNKIKNFTYTNLITNLAIKFLKSKKYKAVINMPINKKKYLPKNFSGYTEFFSSKMGTLGREVMLLYNEKLSISPLTTHVPINKINKFINKKKILNAIKIINNFYKKIIKKENNLLVTGYNPHCGKDFNNNKTDKIISETIKKVKNKIPNISGPYSADTVFINTKDNSSILGMYHDQVLPAFKGKYKFNAANITLGSKFLRLSPDHGPAEELKNKKNINIDSFLYCINFCEKYL